MNPPAAAASAVSPAVVSAATSNVTHESGGKNLTDTQISKFDIVQENRGKIETWEVGFNQIGEKLKGVFCCVSKGV
ncbi:hypothetical protein, partial [Pseudomonas syringae]|uniref:hypothetical protein n=1 Tax=Pseudomonas syringae TaxID=317 RepID=UPI0034D5BB87